MLKKQIRALCSLKRRVISFLTFGVVLINKTCKFVVSVGISRDRGYSVKPVESITSLFA